LNKEQKIAEEKEAVVASVVVVPVDVDVAIVVVLVENDLVLEHSQEVVDEEIRGLVVVPSGNWEAGEVLLDVISATPPRDSI